MITLETTLPSGQASLCVCVGGVSQGDPGKRQSKEAGDLTGPKEVGLVGRGEGRGGIGRPGSRANASRFRFGGEGADAQERCQDSCAGAGPPGSPVDFTSCADQVPKGGVGVTCSHPG